MSDSSMLDTRASPQALRPPAVPDLVLRSHCGFQQHTSETASGSNCRAPDSFAPRSNKRLIELQKLTMRFFSCGIRKGLYEAVALSIVCNGSLQTRPRSPWCSSSSQLRVQPQDIVE